MKTQNIIIIGGGIVGTTVAYYLSMSKHYVILIDHGVGQATRAAAGIICPWLSQRRNKDWYRLTSQGAAFYQNLMADLKRDGIEELSYQQTGTLVFKNKTTLLDKLEKISLKRQSQSPQIGKVTRYEGNLKRLIPPLDTDQGALLASGGGRVDGQKLISNLRDLFLKNGGKHLHGQAELRDYRKVAINDDVLEADQIVLATGAWLPDLLLPLGYHVDIRPQKGQLLELRTSFKTDDWPGCMLHGEIDILPFNNGKLVIGATHEDDKGYDLTIDLTKITQMQAVAATVIPSLAETAISQTRVGIRAYTSDFSPFYGQLPDHHHIWLASGLGSSGLTSGPFIAWQIAKQILGEKTDFDGAAFSPKKYISMV